MSKRHSVWMTQQQNLIRTVDPSVAIPKPSSGNWNADCFATLMLSGRRDLLDAFDREALTRHLWDWKFQARPDQKPPEGDWTTWLVLGGRGAGKTRTGAEWIHARVDQGAERIALVAETYADGREVMVSGPSGLLHTGDPGARVHYEPSRRRLTWPSGAQGYIFSAEDAEGLRGYQFDTAWSDELGCAAIDKGPNQPNVFVDPKSSESARPHFSTGDRDDRAQRTFLEAHHRFWSDSANNPVSVLTGDRMVDPARIFVYAWDARPFPDFPARSEVWADAENWVTGHWLNGRAGRVPLGLVIETIAAEAGLPQVDASACDQLVSGVILPEPESARASLEPLFDLFQLDAAARDGILIVRPRTGRMDAEIAADDLVDPAEGDVLRIERAQDEELPSALSITFTDELSGYELKTVEVRNETIVDGRTARIGTAVVMEQGEAKGRARAILAESRVMREQASFALPELADGLEPGSCVAVTEEAGTLPLRIVSIDETHFRDIEAVRTGRGVFEAAYEGLAAEPEAPIPRFGSIAFEVLDIPLLRPGEEAAHLWLTAFADPWPGEAVIHTGEGEGGARVASLDRLSLMGRLNAPLSPGLPGRWDRASELRVVLPAGGLASVPEADVLDGAHLCAIETASGWEVLQFRDAALEPDGSWVLRHLLRGRRGTELEAATGAEAGARFVVLADAQALPLDPDLWGTSAVFQGGPPGAVPGAYPFRSKTVPLEASGARPLAPVHLTASRTGGETRLNWIRRTRVGGERFGPGDVPLGESEERYRVRVLAADGSELDRFDTLAPSAAFSQADAAAVTVCQVSSAYGEGREAKLTL